MAQVSQELIDLLSVNELTARVTDLVQSIEKEKLVEGTNFSLEGTEYAKTKR
jgi:hypothetical protein